MKWLVVMGLLIPSFGVLGCGGGYDPEKIEAERQAREVEMVAAYCLYGSVSRSQYEGCFSHVSPWEVRHRSTNAARWARGELQECLADAGPACGLTRKAELESASRVVFGLETP